jgi:hypothetical protein
MKKLTLAVNDKEILMNILEAAPNGADIGEIRKAIKLIDKIELAENVVDLEDSEYEYLKEKFYGIKFAKISKDIAQLADRIDNAMPQDMNGG